MSDLPCDLNVANVLAGFKDKEVFRPSEENEGLSVEVTCGGKKWLALIETGCNLVYKKVYEEMELENVDRCHCGEMRGKGSLRIPIIAKFQGVT